MLELFRYIEHAFPVAPPDTDVIDVNSDSDFQDTLRRQRSTPSAADDMRKTAEEFLADNLLSAEPVSVDNEAGLTTLREQALGLEEPDIEKVRWLFSDIFDRSPEELSDDERFLSDKRFLNDAIVATKLTTGFDKVDALRLVSLRQTIHFVERFAAGDYQDVSAASLKTNLNRPVKIPEGLLPPKRALTRGSGEPGGSGEEERQRADALRAEAKRLEAAYEALMSFGGDDLEMVEIAQAPAAPERTRRAQDVADPVPSNDRGPRALLTLSQATERKLSNDIKDAIRRTDLDIRTTELSRMVAKVKERWVTVSKELEPYSMPRPIALYQLGIHTFAVQPTIEIPLAGEPGPMPDFKHAVTRPVGVGNLQVVRQQLIGYEAGEVSHIENILERELYRRSTQRTESTETTVSEERETIESEERDLQTTDRNEMVAESQKEVSKQATVTSGQSSTTEYGKLVENSKTNYARSITDRAVNSLTQRVKEQRVRREQRTFAERSVHVVDNREGASKVRGIYQWVDKKYKNRILTYGKRLLYDVVVPEPAAFLMNSLKLAQQPESFQLSKPPQPWVGPRDINASNYMSLAQTYGVAGGIEPPPDEFVETVAHPETKIVAHQIESFGGKVYGCYHAAYNIQIPPGYSAVSGYIQRVNYDPIHAIPERRFEFYIGEHYFARFAAGAIQNLNYSFRMNGETGQIPVTMRTFANIVHFTYAIGINCKRTDKAYEKWQLKTYAAITEGYRRQLAEYEDKLAQRQAMFRAQLALTRNYARNPSVERTELKKTFLHLLMSEHFGQVHFPAPPPDAFPPDPHYMKKWGAVVAFFERAFEWENMMYFYYPYFWGRKAKWGELVLIQDLDPQFEEFLKAGAARIVVPVRPGFEGALAHYHETGDVWMGEEMPDMFSDLYVSIIEEIKSRNYAPDEEQLLAEWEVKLPTTLVMLKEDADLPTW
jgi:hypothetical protein